MNYTLVKQFSNNAVDNFYNFFYKFVDFFKILIEVFWAFYEIWEAFFLIFYNAFMYVYYFILFVIDKSTESQSTIFFWRRLPRRAAFKPSSVLTRDSLNPIPAMYGKHSASKIADITSSAGSIAGKTVSRAADKLRVAPSGAKVDIGKRILEFFANIIEGLKNIFVNPFKRAADSILKVMKPVKEEEASPKSVSLIDEYMKEYERKKRA
jgi:hypothetical protein